MGSGRGSSPNDPREPNPPELKHWPGLHGRSFGRSERNEIEKNKRGISISGQGTRAEIVDNWVVENTEAGAVYSEGAGGRLERNLFARNGLDGVEVRGSGTSPKSYTTSSSTTAKTASGSSTERRVSFETTRWSRTAFGVFRQRDIKVESRANRKRPHNLLWANRRGAPGGIRGECDLRPS